MALPEGHGGVSNEAAELSSFSALPVFQSDYSRVDVEDGLGEREDEFDPDSTERIHPRRIYSERRGTDDQNTIPTLTRGRQTSSTPLLEQGASTFSTHARHADSHISHHSLSRVTSEHESVHAADLPAALHANFLTSCIGLATLVLLWTPLPVLHWLGWETFHWPGQTGGDASTIWWSLLIIAVGGSVYVSAYLCCYASQC